MNSTLELKHWHEVSDIMAYDQQYASISLSVDLGYGISCKLTQDGNIKIKTRSGGGHGEGIIDDNGRKALEWIELIKEAEMVADHYWGDTK